MNWGYIWTKLGAIWKRQTKKINVIEVYVNCEVSGFPFLCFCWFIGQRVVEKFTSPNRNYRGVLDCNLQSHRDTEYFITQCENWCLVCFLDNDDVIVYMFRSVSARSWIAWMRGWNLIWTEVTGSLFITATKLKKTLIGHNIKSTDKWRDQLFQCSDVLGNFGSWHSTLLHSFSFVVTAC